MSDLINGNKLLAKIRKRRTDTNDVIDYFDVADFELNWIENYIIKEMKANEADTSHDKALHKHNVSNILCGSFDPDNSTSSATKCKRGREKWEHPKAK